MNVLVTAGNTLVPIDRVRAITNIFTGRTGSRIAVRAHDRGHRVTLCTSHPEVVAGLTTDRPADFTERWELRPYRTFADLEGLLRSAVVSGGFDAVVHSAAVSDYQAAGVYAAAAGTRFRPEAGVWSGGAGEPTLEDRSADKVKSDEPELWLRLVRTPKLIDCIRGDWGFAGLLVKFKLEVGIGDDALLAIAERSRQQSRADLMVANTLEGSNSWAYLGPLAGRYERVSRLELDDRLLDALERLHAERGRG